MDKMREEFEAWCASIGFTLKTNDFDNGDYAVGYGMEEWNAWKASRAALCVDLPDGSLNGLEGDSFHGYMRGVEAVSACLDDAGVRYE